MNPGDFPEFFHAHLMQYQVRMPAYIRPTYCILGRREWQYFQEHVRMYEGPVRKMSKEEVEAAGHLNPMYEDIQLLKSNTESLIKFVE